MLAANLATYFARRQNYPLTGHLSNKRVLLIDFDYQGSLSGMLLTALGAHVGTLHVDTRAETLLDEGFSPEDAFIRRVPPTPAIPNLSLFPANYGFDDFETREQFRWLSGGGTDVRFSLLRRLTSAPFQGAFDLVIIDTGPRMTTAAVAAIAAATHVLVPTIPERRSIEAAERFLRRVAVFRDAGIAPRLKALGVVATLTGNTATQLDAVENARIHLATAVHGDVALQQLFGGNSVFLQNTLVRSQPVQNQADASIPYLEATQTRHIFNAIGLEVEQRMQ